MRKCVSAGLTQGIKPAKHAFLEAWMLIATEWKPSLTYCTFGGSGTVVIPLLMQVSTLRLPTKRQVIFVLTAPSGCITNKNCTV
jgi:hypothetical protein